MQLPSQHRERSFVHARARMVRIGAALLVSTLCLQTAIAAQPTTPPTTQPALARDLSGVIASGTLRVALTHFDLPAFHWHEGDAFAGPEILLAQEIGRAMGVKVEFVDDATSFNGVVDSIVAGRADIGISKLSQTYTRLMRVRFSDPYITLRHALLFQRAAVATVANGRAPDEVLRKFHGRIGVIRGSSYVEFGRRNFPDAILVEMADWTVANEALLAGKVDALYRDEFEIRRVLKNSPALNVRLGAAIVTDQRDTLSVAICDTCAKLQQFINHHLGRNVTAFTMQDLLNSDLRDRPVK